MDIEAEIAFFDEKCGLLTPFIDQLSMLERDQIADEHLFLAEAVMFRLYRNYERFVRAAFLHHCVVTRTLSGADVSSKLRCEDWNTAESILKSANRFLDWGNPQTIQQLSNLVFANGFPISELVGPVYTTLVDLQRFRNFVAHDSQEAAGGYKKSRDQYVRPGDAKPETVGELALYRRGQRGEIVLRIVHGKVSPLSQILRAL